MIIFNYKTQHMKFTFIKKLNTIGTFILLVAFILAWYMYDWKLVLILFLMLSGNNLEQTNK